jgi:hypothetical protein
MGGACNTLGTGKKFIQNLVREPERKRLLGDLSVDGRIILSRIWSDNRRVFGLRG